VIDDRGDGGRQLRAQGLELGHHRLLEDRALDTHDDRRAALAGIALGPHPGLAAECQEQLERPQIGQRILYLLFGLARVPRHLGQRRAQPLDRRAGDGALALGGPRAKSVCISASRAAMAAVSLTPNSPSKPHGGSQIRARGQGATTSRSAVLTPPREC